MIDHLSFCFLGRLLMKIWQVGTFMDTGKFKIIYLRVSDGDFSVKLNSWLETAKMCKIL